MSKNLMLIIAAVVVVVAGGFAYVTMNKDAGSSDGDTNTSQSDDSTEGQNQAFAAQGLENESFEAVISGSQDGKAYQITMQSDGEGRMRLFGEQDGQDFETVYTDEAYYSCSAGECIKFPVSQSEGSGFEPSEYVYDDDKISDLGDTANYLGQRDCPAGRCDAWEVTEDGYSSTIYLDSNDRISQVIGNTAEGEVKIVYTFKSVNIEIPANAQEIPALQP